MNKKILSFSLVSSILAGSVSGVVSANWKEKLNKLAEKDLEDGKKIAEKLEHFNFYEELGVTGEMKGAVNAAINAMQEYKQSYLNLKWHNKKSKNTEQEKHEEEALLKEIKEKEKEANKLIKNAKKLFKITGLLDSVVFPWDDIEKKYSFLFKKEKDLDLDETNKESILKKLTFITENEEKSKFADEYINKTKRIAKLREELRFALEKFKQDRIESLKKELIKVYSERQILNRKIVKEWISKNKYISFEYPFVLYRDGNIPKDVIVEANRQIMKCNDTLKKILKIADKIKTQDAYFNEGDGEEDDEEDDGEEPAYKENKYGVYERDYDFAENNKKWVNKGKLKKINQLIELKKELNLQKEQTEGLVSLHRIFLPWNKIDKKNGKWTFLFNLEENKDLDKKYDLSKLYCDRTIDDEEPDKRFVCKITVRRLKDESRQGKLCADYMWYSNQVAFARQYLREDKERGEKNSTYWEQELVLFFQARQWTLKKMEKEEKRKEEEKKKEEAKEKTEHNHSRPNCCNIF